MFLQRAENAWWRVRSAFLLTSLFLDPITKNPQLSVKGEGGDKYIYCQNNSPPNIIIPTKFQTHEHGSL
jgi:hypothetical protein